MPTPSQESYYHRRPRARLYSTTPVALRFADGRQSRGELKVVSLTGGLLSLQRPVDWGCRVKLLFLTQTGVVLGEAEMLSPDCWSLQPFRFVSLGEGDQCRLKAAIELSLRQNVVGRVD
jgi:hypothetical protein